MEAVRRASLNDEESLLLRATKFAVGASSSIVYEAERSTSAGAVVAEDTTYGVLTTEGVGSGQPNPPAC